MKFKHDIEAQAGFKDKDGQLGAAGQILSSTGSQTDWITQGDIVAGNADRALSLTMAVKNSTGTTIPTGSVVCFDNSVATPSGNVITVKLADNNGTDSMPAVGVTNGAIADGAEGIAIMFGKASGFNTSSFSTGDALYVSDTPGAFTTTKPTDVKYIQRIGIVVKVHASNGTIEVFGAGRVNDVPTPLYIDHANQRLGIGTTSPSQKLHVVGNTKIEGVVVVDSSNDSLYIGSSTTGQSSTSTGDRNVVIGPSAFRSNTSAKYNTAVGHAAMQDTTTGNYNSVLGNQALRDNIDGDFNVAVGNQTMAFTTNSSNNTAVGYRALYQAQSGSNTAIGQGAFNSLQSSTSSGGNTGIGQEVLNKITSGRRNVGVGHAAGQKYGGGNNNVVTANDSVFIGADSDAGGDNQTNQIVIGYNAIGLGSNTAVLGNNSIVTTQLKGNVGIGTTSPSEKLDVNGNISVSGNINLTDGAIIGVNGGETFTIDKITGGGTANLTLGTNTTVTGGFTINNAAGLQFGSGANKLLANTGSTFQFSKTGGGVANYEFTSNVASVTFLNTGNVGIGTTSPGEKLTLQTQATGLGSEGVFIKNPFAGSTPIVNSKSPFLSLATSNSSGYTSTIYMGRNGTATGQESKIEWSNSNNGLSIYVAGQGSYREHVRFGNLSSSVARTYFNGNVGIGTTSPSKKLHVTGAAQVDNGGLLLGGTSSVDGNNPQLRRANSSNDLRIATAGSDRMTILGTGNVGIGTTSPATKLHIGSTSTSGTTTEEFRLQSGTSSGNGGTAIANLVTGSFGTSGIYFGNSSTYTSQDAYLKYADSNNATTLHFSSSLNLEQGTSGSKMYINSSGNVGIGTTNPSRKLQVIGTDGVAKFYYNSSFTNAQYSVVDIGMMTSGTAANGFGPKITFRMGGNGYDGYTAGSIGTIRNGADNTHNLNFATSNGGSMTTKMTITNTGNVGIGTNSPAHKLHVVGTNNDPIIRAVRGNNTSQYLDIRGYQVLSQGNHLLLTADDTKEIWLGQESNTQRMVINSSGKVGIGTTSPADFLHIGSVGGGSIRIETYETNAYAQIASADGNLSLRSDPSNSYSLSIIDFTIDNNEKMRITSAGNVGIGTTSPAYLLDVNEDDNVLAFRVTGGGGGAPIASFVRDVGATGSSVNINAQSNFPQIQFANTGNTFSIGGDTSGNFKISDNTAIGTNDRITINNTGNVGIGTTSPSNKLDVNGIIEADKLILPTAGTAGAGTVTTPAGKLDVRSDSTWSNSAIVARGTTNQNPVLAFYRPSGGAATSYPWWLEANGSTFQIKTGSAANIGSESVSTKVTINNSGDVGIGTTSPAAKLEVNGTSLLRGLVNITTSGEMLRLNDTNSSGNPYMSFYQSGARRSFIQHNDSGDYLKLASEYGGISFFTGTGGTSTQKMTILSGGDVGIGTTSPGSRLSVIDASTGRTWSDYFATVATFERNSDSNINIVSSNTGNGAIWFGDTSSMVRGRIRYAHNGDEMSFWVSAAPRATLDSSGNLAITGTLSQNSDIVLKENVEDIDGALEKVKQLRGVEFNMIGDDKKRLGVIAQEVEKVLPELVTEKDDIRSVAYGNIAAVLIEAIKEQQNQIENLESRIQTLENQ